MVHSWVGRCCPALLLACLVLPHDAVASTTVYLTMVDVLVVRFPMCQCYHQLDLLIVLHAPGTGRMGVLMVPAEFH